MVMVSRKEYKALLEDSCKLSYLEGFGVDNWEGYDEAMKAFRKEKRSEDEDDD